MERCRWHCLALFGFRYHLGVRVLPARDHALSKSEREKASAGSAEPGAFDIAAARAELERVLAGESLRSSARSREFLRFVVEETLAGRGASIKAYTIAIDCFDREPDFDPQIDPYVRILARRLRRALNHYYEAEGAQDPLRIVLPKGGYVPEFISNEPGALAPRGSARSALAPVIGKPESLAAEVSREPSIERSASCTPVAIVRFDSQGDPEDQAYLASGLTEELIVDLTSFSQIEVIGPLLGGRLDDARCSPADIGRENDADFVLWGSMRRLGNKVKVVANLCEVSSCRTIWAERYERDLTVSDLFEIQGEISQSVAATIGDAGGVIVRKLTERSLDKRPESLTSYEAVLRGYHWDMVMTQEAFEDAYVALRHAVQTDPNCALCRALLSDIYFSDWLSAVGTFEDGLERAEEMAGEAVALDPECADAHWVMGQVHFGRRRFEQFSEEFEIALSRNPNKVLIVACQALYLVGLLDWDRAMEMVDRAMRLNPHHPSWYHLVPCLNHARQGMWLEALQDARRFRAPGLLWGPLLRTSALGHLDRVEEAQRHLQDLLVLQPEFESNGREIVSRLLNAEKNVVMILEGVEKAGLTVAR
jgi:adenylate cyclase